MLLVPTLSASAIVADPAPKTVVQPDGSEITVVMHGDEHGHYFALPDGAPLLRDGATGRFEAATLQQAYTTGMPASRVATSAVMGSRGRSDYLISTYPTLGRQKSLVILVEFSDLEFTSVSDPLSFYESMLNGVGFTHENGARGSARDFYLDSSNGLFDPEFVVYGPVTLSKGQTYYGSDDTSQDFRMGELIQEACTLLDDEIDFSEFDLDEDGYVDNIYFFYAGGGQADDPNGTDYIWPHSAEVEEAWGLHLEYDGKVIGHYATSNEVRYSSLGTLYPAGIGTFVHEFGHVLGLTDHYDVYYGYLTHDPGTWDTMAMGAYNNNMHTPPAFSAFERAELGWLDYDELTADHAGFIDLADLNTCNKAYRLKVEGGTDEFFVFENRQQSGWDLYLPGHGLLVWHIDQDSEAWTKNHVNIDASHQRVDIVEADGVASTATYSGDAFPGTSGVTEFDFTSWDNATVATLADATEYDGVVTFLLGNTAFKMPAPQAIEILEVDDETLTFTWTPVKHARYYLVTVVDEATGEAVGVLDDMQYFSADTVVVSSLEPEMTYEISLAAGVQNYISSTTTQKVVTTATPFSKRRVEGLSASAVTNTGFTVTWEALAEAEQYLLSLNSLSYSNDFSAGYDFTGKYNDMPLTWNTTSTRYYSVAGWYGAASPSLQLSTTGQYLSVAYDDTLIDGLSFWARAKSDNSSLILEGLEDGQWVELQTVEIPTTAKTFNLNFDNQTAVRLVASLETNFIVIDDVVASCHGLERCAVASQLTTTAPTYTFSDLTPGATYGVYVTAMSSEATSLTSEELSVILPTTDAITLVGADQELLDKAIYDLQGRRIYLELDQLRPGIYIINHQKVYIP